MIHSVRDLCAKLRAQLSGTESGVVGKADYSPVEGRARGLLEILQRELPVEGPDLPPQAGWPLVGPALIARQGGTLESILKLQPLGRSTDPLILVRSLYDHAATFAWLAAAPGPDRLERFLKSDAQARLDADNDCRKIGVPILTDQMRQRFEAQVAEYPKQMPALLQRAEGADGHWAAKLPGLRGAETTHSYRGFYAIAYRRQSAVEHASLMGLNNVVTDLPAGRKRVDLEGPSKDISNPLGNATILLAFSLYIAADQLDWATRDAVGSVFNKFSE